MELGESNVVVGNTNVAPSIDGKEREVHREDTKQCKGDNTGKVGRKEVDSEGKAYVEGQT